MKLKITSILMLAVVVSFSFLAFAPKADVYTVDLSKSSVTWEGKKFSGAHTGSIGLTSGTLSFNGKKLAGGDFVANMTTIKTMDGDKPSPNLDKHLKNDDFFGVEKFPKATFVLTKVAKIAKGNALVKGNMTIKGKTVPIEFKAVFQEAADGMKVYANITLDRTKFDIRYGSGSFFENLGDKTIYNDFNITLTLVNKKK